MRAPAGLGSAGKGAWGRAVRALDGYREPELFADAAGRYAWAVHLAAVARAEWRRAGEPAVLVHPNGTVGEHPLVRAMQSAERDADRFGRALRLDPASRSRLLPGRPRAAVSAPDRRAPGEPPRLRVAGDRPGEPPRIRRVGEPPAG